jgi:hypothetical protein
LGGWVWEEREPLKRGVGKESARSAAYEGGWVWEERPIIYSGLELCYNLLFYSIIKYC